MQVLHAYLVESARFSAIALFTFPFLQNVEVLLKICWYFICYVVVFFLLLKGTTITSKTLQREPVWVEFYYVYYESIGIQLSGFYAAQLSLWTTLPVRK